MNGIPSPEELARSAWRRKIDKAETKHGYRIIPGKNTMTLVFPPYEERVENGEELRDTAVVVFPLEEDMESFRTAMTGVVFAGGPSLANPKGILTLHLTERKGEVRLNYLMSHFRLQQPKDNPDWKDREVLPRTIFNKYSGSRIEGLKAAIEFAAERGKFLTVDEWYLENNPSVRHSLDELRESTGWKIVPRGKYFKIWTVVPEKRVGKKWMFE